ncbi:MAG: class I adenylate-forming enzyme family protein [Planctomycetota bacterium]
MIVLQPSDPLAVRFLAGECYQMGMGADGCLPDEARIVWSYLCQAIEHPISLEVSQAIGERTADSGPVAVPSLVARGCSQSTLALHTSGTTGKPQRCEHQLSAVLEAKRKGESHERWLLTFAPFRWAGLSVMLHVLKAEAILIVPSDLDPQAMIQAGIDGSTSHISLTPSMFKRWKLTCKEDALRALPVSQVTFGGEAASQAVLDAAKCLWPEARVTHVYAASEFGDVCGVSDGQEGVPRRKFEREPFRISDEDELFIDERSTGDIWQLRGERYVFFGRTEEVINVGGAKVSPFDVERAALGIQGLMDARAFAIPSPLLGQLVGLEYSGAVDELTVKKAMRLSLPKVACPAEVKRVEKIDLTDAGKTRRQISL